MNITLLSLTLSNVYTNSPVLAGNNVVMRNSIFSQSISSYILNPISLYLNSCQFSKIQGFIINKNEFSSNLPMKEVSLFGETIDRDGKVEIKNEDFSQNNQYFIIAKNLVIHDCIFHDINFDEGHDGKSPIQIEGSLPFYMTNCIIREIKGRKSAIHLTIKAATIDHICMYNCESETEHKYMHIDITKESFCKIIFSTFAEDNGQMKGSGAYEFKYGYFQLNCVNFSNIQSKDYSLKITDPNCCIFSMNTVSKLNCNQDIFQTPILSSSYLYFNYNNIIDCVYTNSLFYYNQNWLQNDKSYFKNCYFNGNKFDGDDFNRNHFKFNGQSIDVDVYFYSCSFDVDPTSDSSDWVKKLHVESGEFVTNDNIHFVTDEYCRGTKAQDALKCGQDQCPDDEQCDKNHFDFTYGEDTYTLIHHTDINTPSRSPTKEFSESSAFTFSSYFSFSKYFSESDDFSKSFYFSKTEDFSETEKFSKTEIFSETEDFTFSFDFTKSKSFTQSDDLDRTRAFTKSNYFSESLDFTQSDDFTKTNGFSKSDDFTFSKYFSESKELKTRIIIFTPSNIFTKSDFLPPAGGVDKQGSGGKLSPGALAGIIVGAIAAAAIIIILAIFFIIKRKKNMDLPTDANIIDGQESTISVENTLQSIMDKDDPFADEFNE